MIVLDEEGGLRFRGRLYRDGGAISRIVARLSDEIAECLATAFDAIERGDVRIFKSIYPGWYFAEQCGFWVHFSVEPDQEWGKVLLLDEVT